MKNKLYMAFISGYTEIIAFADTEEKAQRKAIKLKKAHCKDDLEKWNWQTVSDYYGASLMEISKDTDAFIL